MTGLLDEVRYGARYLAKRPGSTAISLLTLAVAVGANTAIFSVVSGVLLNPLPYPDADRIVRVLEKPPGGDRNGISTLNYLDWKASSTSFEYMAATTGGSLTLSGSGLPVQLRGARVSSHYFDIFGIKATLGRTFADDEDQHGKNHVAVLSTRCGHHNSGLIAVSSVARSAWPASPTRSSGYCRKGAPSIARSRNSGRRSRSSPRT